MGSAGHAGRSVVGDHDVAMESAPPSDAPDPADEARDELVVWAPDRAPELVELLRASAPAEELSTDEVLAVCWEGHPTAVVLADPDGRGAVGVVLRRFGAPPDDVAVAWVTALAVPPEHRRQGLGRRLLAAAERWAATHGAIELHLGGSAPFYLWPGVDLLATELVCLAEDAGYEATGSELDMVMPSAYRAPVPEGVVIRRVVTEADVDALAAFVHTDYPWWWDEVARAVEHGCCHGAFVADGEDGSGERCIGFACHSVNRAGMLGPMATEGSRRHRGVGSALVGQVCRDLMIAEYDETRISWVGPVRFYAKAGARIARVYRTYKKRLTPLA